LRKYWNEVWERFKIIGALVGDGNARAIAILFYFTVFVPFGIVARLLTDPLRLRDTSPSWLDREPVPSDLDSAREQG